VFSNARKFFITAKTDSPIADLLHHHLPPGTDIQTVLDSGGVWLDRKRITQPDKVITAGLTVVAYVARNQGRRYTVPAEHIVYEDDNLIAVYKPAGVTSQSDRSDMHYNLTAGIAAYFRSRGLYYAPSPINRLDYMVSGICLYPKHKAAEKYLFRLTRERAIHKWYKAWLPKQPELPRCLRVKDTLSHLGKAYLDPAGQPAHSLFIKTQETNTAVCYSVFIFTGRRHQIRFHAAQYLAPILGDSLYGSNIKLPGESIGLVAFGYNFHYRNDKIRVRLPETLTRQPSFVGTSKCFTNS
jgi:23S rRNA-/tRNA-specific pseudouridylate synthase